MTDLVILNEWGPTTSYHIRLGDPLEALQIPFKLASGKEPWTEEAVSDAKTVLVQRGAGDRITQLATLAKVRGCRLVYDTDESLLAASRDPRLKSSEQQQRNIASMVGLADVVTVSTAPLADLYTTMSASVQLLETYGLSRPRVRQEARPRLCVLEPGKVGPGAAALFGALEVAIEHVGYDIVLYGAADDRAYSLRNRFGHRVSLRETLPEDRSAFLDVVCDDAINVAAVPLALTGDTIYQSDTAYLDFASLGIPGLFNNGLVFSAVRPKVNGFLCTDTQQGWVDGIVFFADPRARRACGELARRSISLERSLDTYAARLKDVLGLPSAT